MQYKKLTTIKDWPDVNRVKIMSVDIETTGLSAHTDQIVNCGFYAGTGTVYYTEDLGVMKDILILPCDKIFHNAVFDVSHLMHKGCTIGGTLHDTMVLAHVLDSNDSSKLKDQAVKYLGPNSIQYANKLYAWLKENNLTKAHISKAPPEILTPYVCEDVINTFNLFKLYCVRARKLADWLKTKDIPSPWDYYKNEGCALIPVLVNMYMRGVSVDLNMASQKKLDLKNLQSELLHELSKKSLEPVSKAEKLLHEAKVKSRLSKNKTGKLKKEIPPIQFNWNSNDHLAALFFKVLKTTPTKFTAKKKPSVSADFLQAKVSEFPWLAPLLNYRKVEKLLGTYVEPVLTKHLGGRIHANILITGTDTGRFSCINPNLQNLPRFGKEDKLHGPTDIKSLYRPTAGHVFLYADYSQLELRLAAHLSEDKLLIQAYHEGLDLHQITTDIINKEYHLGVIRDQGKRLNFSIIYNASGLRIAEILGLEASIAHLLPECGCLKLKKPAWKDCIYHKELGKIADLGKSIGHSLFGQYKGLRDYLDKQLKFMKIYKVNVSDFGRIRRLPDLKLDPKENRSKYNHAVKAGFNHRIQSDGASICKRAMVNLHNENFAICNQVHDAIYTEVLILNYLERLDRMKHIMETVVRLKVPLLVEPKVLNSFNESDIYTP